MPPSDIIKHNENDSRKYIPFTGPIRKIEPILITTSREEQSKKITLRYKYEYHKGFTTHSALMPLGTQEIIEKTLNELKLILDNFIEEKKELLFTCFLSIITSFILLLFVQIITMTSE